MQEVPSEHEGVDGGEDSVDPPGGDEQSLSLLDDTLIAHIHLVTEERLTLIGRGHPGLIQRQVCLGGSHQVEHFLPLKSDLYFGNTGVNINSQVLVYNLLHKLLTTGQCKFSKHVIRLTTYYKRVRCNYKFVSFSLHICNLNIQM